MRKTQLTTFLTRASVAALLAAAVTGASAGKTAVGSDLLPALSDAGQWQLVNNAGPQVRISRQGAIDVDTFTGTVTQGDGKATDVTIQPVRAVPLADKQKYKLVYDIRGDQLRDVRVIVQTVGDKQLNFFILNRKRQIGLGYSHFEDDFVATHLSGRPVLVEFAIGAYEGPVYLENVSLNAIAPQPGSVPPTNG